MALAAAAATPVKLIYAAKLSMADSLQLRVPYLDREVPEYAQCLSASLKIRHGCHRFLRRRVRLELLPHEVTTRRKMGFSRQLEELLLDPASKMYSFLKLTAVEELLRAHRAGSEDNHKILLSLVLIEMWLRNWTASDSCHARDVVTN